MPNYIITSRTKQKKNLLHLNKSHFCNKQLTNLYSFDLSCPILENDNVIENMYIVLKYALSYPIVNK